MKRGGILYLFLWVLIFFLSSGQNCVTTSQGTKLQAQIDDLRAHDAQLEEKQKALLDSVATSNGAKANAIADLDELRSNVQELRGKTEELESTLSKLQNKDNSNKDALDKAIADMDARVRALEEKTGLVKAGAGGGEDKTAQNEKAAYEDAYSMYKAERFEEAKNKFKAFVKKYPNSRNAANAQYYLGECLYSQQDYENAVLQFDKVISSYPGSDKLPAAYLKLGYSFLKLNQDKDAKLFFQKIITDFPDSEQAEIARKMLKQIP